MSLSGVFAQESDPVSIRFDAEQYQYDEKITITIYDPNRKLSLQVLIETENGSKHIVDAFESQSTPGIFIADFFPDSVILVPSEKITATYSYFHESEKRTKTAQSRIINFIETQVDNSLPYSNYTLSIQVFDEFGDEFEVGIVEEPIRVIANSQDNVMLQVFHFFSGLNFMNWSNDHLEIIYVPQKPGLYRIVASEFNHTHTESIFKDIVILPKENTVPILNENASSLFNGRSIEDAMSVQPSVVTSFFNITEEKIKQTIEEIENATKNALPTIPQTSVDTEYSNRTQISSTEDLIKQLGNTTVEPQKPPENIFKIQISPASAVAGCEKTNKCFQPSIVSVNTDQMIMWTNMDAIYHTVTGNNLTTEDTRNFDSGYIAKGETFTYTFDNAGTFDYSCTIYPWMQGTIVVNDNPKIDVIREYGYVMPKESQQLHSAEKNCKDMIMMQSIGGKIACVGELTAQKLVERGWGIILE